MRLSICVDTGRPWAEVRQIGELADRHGWHAAYVCDHFLPYAGGRVVLGLGAGWQLNEHVAYGIGGGGPRRTARIAATYADIWHTWASPSDFLRKCDVLDSHCLGVGRDPAGVERATGQVVRVTASPAPGPEDDDVVGTTEQITETLTGYANSRATEFIVRDGRAVPVEEVLDMMSALTTEVLPHLADLQPS